MSIAVDFIKEAEGLRLEAYRDGAGHWTIGYGHTAGVTYGMEITAEQAEAFLIGDMKWTLDLIEALVKVPLNENQHASVASLIFNIGASGWRSSTALRRLNAGNYAGTAEAMTWWNKITVDGEKVVSDGLVKRRERERALFLSGAPVATATGAARGKVSGGEAKPARKSKTQWLGLSGVLTVMLTAWGQIRRDAPEVIVVVGDYAPYVLGLIFVAVMFNRWLESRKGEH